MLSSWLCTTEGVHSHLAQGTSLAIITMTSIMGLTVHLLAGRALDPSSPPR